MNAVLIGNSFIRRFRQRLLPSSGRRDIADSADATSMAALLGVSRHLQGVYTCSENINLISHLSRTIPLLKQLKITPDIIMLQVASNDIAGFQSYQPQSCQQLVHQLRLYADLLFQSVGVKLIIFNSVLPRTARLAASPQVFEQNLTSFNQQLKDACAHSNANIKFHKLRGFYGLSGSDSTTPAVTTWSDDGIHCAGPAENHYEARIRHGLLYFKQSASQ